MFKLKPKNPITTKQQTTIVSILHNYRLIKIFVVPSNYVETAIKWYKNRKGYQIVEGRETTIKSTVGGKN